MSELQDADRSGLIHRTVWERLLSALTGLRFPGKRNRPAYPGLTQIPDRSHLAGRRLRAWLSQTPFSR